MGKSTIVTGADFSTQRVALKIKDIPVSSKEARFIFSADKYESTFRIGDGTNRRIVNPLSDDLSLDPLTTSDFGGATAPVVSAQSSFGNRNCFLFRQDSPISRPFRFNSNLEKDDFTIHFASLNQSNVALSTQRSLFGFNCSNGDSLGFNIGGGTVSNRIAANGTNYTLSYAPQLSVRKIISLVYTKVDSTLKAYVDGVLDSTFTGIVFKAGLQGPALLGCSNSGGVNYHGYLPMFQGFARAFTAAEVLATYNQLNAAYTV